MRFIAPLVPLTLASLAAAFGGCGPGPGHAPQLAVPNDHRTPAGALRDGVLELRLEARLAAWRPDAGVDTAVTVLAFAEEGGPARIPGPLLRAAQGTEVVVSVRNAVPDSARSGLPPRRLRTGTAAAPAHGGLIVHGLRAGTVPDDTLHVAPGATREVRFRAEAPGTYLYWGAASESPIGERTGRDALLTGAIVVDPAGVAPDPAERAFVITEIDILPDSTKPPPVEDIFEMAVNGLSWPHTERLAYALGDTVRWRWVNGTSVEHPMHLHGFHFRILARSEGPAQEAYAPEASPLAVTEVVPPGGSFHMEWVPTRAGNWLVHCHIVAHIVPFPERDPEARAHDVHDLARHPLEGMAGLVLGITVTDPGGEGAEDPRPAKRLRLFAQEAPERTTEAEGVLRRGFVLQEGPEPPPDSVPVTGPALLLTRDETAAITVVNRLAEATTVHWHGMELESYFDGVSGWSGLGARLAPLIAPGDSFTVRITPPRAGTFIYHTHMDEADQLGTGLYGPLLVLEPDETFVPERDHVFVIGEAVEDGRRGVAINGHHEPGVLQLRAGREHRLRLINIQPDATAHVRLVRDSVPLRWRPAAKDGADLPPALRAEGEASARLGVGETYDVLWTPGPGEATLLVRVPFLTETGELLLRQPIRIR